MGGAEKLLCESIPVYQKKNIKIDVLLLKSNATPLYKYLKNVLPNGLFSLTQGSVYNPLLIFKIIPYLKSYDVLHVHLFPSLYWVVLAKILSFSKTPIVYTEHSTNNKRRNNPFFKIIDRFIYSKLNRVITIADEVDSELKKHLQFRKNDFFTLIANGIAIEKFSEASSLDRQLFFEGESKLLIQVSSFRYPKDQETLIKSLTLLPEFVKLLLVGDGPNKKACEEIAKNLGVDHRVLFLGIRTDVPQLLQTADIIVLSSKYEGLSLSSIEGMSVNKPFIATDAPGLREIVKNFGLLFKQGDSEALADHILNLNKDKDYYDEIAGKCLVRAKEFDIQKMVDKYIEVYKKLLINAN